MDQLIVEEKKKNICNYIAGTRRFKQVSQEELANACGLNKATISNIEKGKGGFSFDSLIKICDYLGVELLNPAITWKGI